MNYSNSNNNSNIPSHIMADAEKYFSKSTIQSAIRLLQQSRANISFKKGTPETYYIVSGIVRDNRAHESKLVYKKRLEGAPEGPLSSNCDCSSWQADCHCEHTACLFLGFHLHIFYESEGNIQEEGLSSMPPVGVFGSYAVNVDEYGTLVSSAARLIGAPPSATYSSLQYHLKNNKIINFPIPENFVGRILISIHSKERFNEVSGAIENLPVVRYRYQREDGEIVPEISLFENIYLFDWRNGTSYHLPPQLKALIQKIRINEKDLSINDLILLSTELYLENVCEIIIDDVPLSAIPVSNTNLKITLNQGDKRGQINTTLIFHDDNERIIIPPEFLSMLTFEGGLLNSFKRKKDAYQFIEELTQFFATGSTGYKQTLNASSNKKRWIDLINYLMENEKTYLYDGSSKTLCIYENSFLKILLTSILNNFDELFFRYSEYNSVTRELNYQVTPSTIFQGLPSFYQANVPYGVTIFYDRNEISQWSSKVRFERRSSGTKWFDIELNVGQDDLQVIKNADIDNGLAFTANGLVLLSTEQKDMLRFMKKYTQYESQSEEVVEGTEEEGPITKFIVPFNRARIFELFELRKYGLDGALTEEEIELCNRLASLEEVPEYPIPDSLVDVLRPYQKVGYNWLRFLYENKLGACLADDMGLGKTLQAIAFIKSVYDDIDKVLIVCPVSIILNWENEINKFSDGIDINIYHGGTRSILDKSKVILTSYGVMKREFDTTFSTIHFDIMILDEVQHLKNIRSMGAFAARKVSADFRICLTGTPVENDLAEFYNIIDLSIPGIWGDLQFIRTTSTTKSRLLARKTASPFILRRTKDQVLTDLPPKIENNIPLAFSDGEEEHYKQNLLDIKSRIKNAPSKKKYGEILRGLLQLRQNCLWQKRPKNADAKFGTFDSVKVDFLVETLEQIIEEGHQAIVFSQFTTYLDLIQEVLNRKAWRLSRIDGSQSIKKRQSQVDEFQEGKTQVFLISLKAGGVGLNLTAASYVFLMDPWWNPAVEQQAIDRAHRIGQENTLTVYRPIIKGSVEEKVLDLQEIKKQLFKDLLADNDDNSFTGKLSMKDFEHLFT